MVFYCDGLTKLNASETRDINLKYLCFFLDQVCAASHLALPPVSMIPSQAEQ